MSRPEIALIDKADLRIVQLKALVDLIGAVDLDRIRKDTLGETSILMDEMLTETGTAVEQMANLRCAGTRP